MSEKIHMYSWKSEQQQLVWTWTTEDKKNWSFLLFFNAHCWIVRWIIKKQINKQKTNNPKKTLETKQTNKPPPSDKLCSAFVISDNFPLQIFISLYYGVIQECEETTSRIIAQTSHYHIPHMVNSIKIWL